MLLLGPAVVGEELHCIRQLRLRLHLMATLTIFSCFQYLCSTKAKDRADIPTVYESEVSNNNTLRQQSEWCQICKSLHVEIPFQHYSVFLIFIKLCISSDYKARNNGDKSSCLVYLVTPLTLSHLDCGVVIYWCVIFFPKAISLF